MSKSKDPTWEHVERLVSERIKCNYCKAEYSALVTRLKAHLEKISCKDINICHDVPESVSQAFWNHLEMLDRCKGSRITSTGSTSVLPQAQHQMQQSQAQGQTSHVPISQMFAPVQPTQGQRTIFSMVKKKEKVVADLSMMEMLVDNTIPFNVLRTDSFKKFVEDISNYGQGYRAPSYETARTKLLGLLKERADEYVRSVRSQWALTGCTMMSDGWTDRRNRPHINLLVAFPHGTVFLKSVCTTGARKDAKFIAYFISFSIEESIGAKNVVQVIADNASNYTAARVILETRYPHIFKTNCIAHCIDFILEDIDRLEHVMPVLEKARKIVNFLYRYQYVYDLMKVFTKGAELKRSGATRFTTQFLYLQSILKQEQPLRNLVASDEWRILPQSKSVDGEEIGQIIQGLQFWDTGKDILEAVEPLVKILRMVDGEGSTMGYIYDGMDRAKEAIKKVYKDDLAKYDPLWKIIDNRWNNQLYAVAAFLNPQLLYSDRVVLDEEVRDGFSEVCDRMMPTQKVAIAEELGYFGGKHKKIFDKILIGMLKSTHPRVWWTLCGHTLPNLRQLAMKVLSQPYSAFAYERNWSAFEVVHTKKRNRLDTQKLHDLVYVKLNLHLQKTSKDKQEKDSAPIFIEHLEGSPVGNTVADDDDPVIGDIEDEKTLGDSEEEEDELDFLNPSIF